MRSARRIEQFAIAAAILGFIVDSVTVIAVLLSIHHLPSQVAFVNSLHALLIWCVATFSYVCWLQIVWRRRIQASTFVGSFGEFLIYYVPSRELQLLLPAVVALGLLVWVWVQIIIDFPPMLIVLIPLLFITGGGTLQFVAVTLDSLARRKFVSDIDNEWSKWNKLIGARLVGMQWLSAHDFQDIMRIWHVGDSDVKLLMARYAAANARTVRYGTVRSRTKGKGVVANDALINLSCFNDAAYWH